jgi:molecular chaperone Hsp33
VTGRGGFAPPRQVRVGVPGDDLVQTFQIDRTALRGRLVRLGPLVDGILKQHAYPEPVAAMLGEAVTLAVMLAGMLKYEGVFTLQTKGDGPIRLMVADVTTAGAVRGYAQYDEAKLAHAASGAGAPVPRLLGGGYIAFTVDQGEATERYQGIVELQGATLAECAHHYFRQSEQLQAGIKVAVAREGDAWRAGGIMLQRLPSEGGEASAAQAEAQEEGWRRAMILMSSSTSGELVDPALAPNELLFRLFHEDGVRVWAPHALAAQCRCSRERIERILLALPTEDLDDLALEDGRLEVTCEFCSRRYQFARDAVETLQRQRQ